MQNHGISSSRNGSSSRQYSQRSKQYHKRKCYLITINFVVAARATPKSWRHVNTPLRRKMEWFIRQIVSVRCAGAYWCGHERSGPPWMPNEHHALLTLITTSTYSHIPNDARPTFQNNQPYLKTNTFKFNSMLLQHQGITSIKTVYQ